MLGPHCSYDFNYVLVEGDCCGNVIVDDDYCWVHAVKVGKPANIPFLTWLESHPNMFPILKILLKMVGLY